MRNICAAVVGTCAQSLGSDVTMLPLASTIITIRRGRVSGVTERISTGLPRSLPRKSAAVKPVRRFPFWSTTVTGTVRVVRGSSWAGREGAGKKSRTARQDCWMARDMVTSPITVLNIDDNDSRDKRQYVIGPRTGARVRRLTDERVMTMPLTHRFAVPPLPVGEGCEIGFVCFPPFGRGL